MIDGILEGVFVLFPRCFPFPCTQSKCTQWSLKKGNNGGHEVDIYVYTYISIGRGGRGSEGSGRQSAINWLTFNGGSRRAAVIDWLIIKSGAYWHPPFNHSTIQPADWEALQHNGTKRRSGQTDGWTMATF